MKQIFLSLIAAISVSSARGEVLECESAAMKLVAAKFGAEFTLRSFDSQTPGSYYQEYLGVFIKSGTGEKIEVRFYSHFICDDLEIVEVN